MMGLLFLVVVIIGLPILSLVVINSVYRATYSPPPRRIFTRSPRCSTIKTVPQLLAETVKAHGDDIAHHVFDTASGTIGTPQAKWITYTWKQYSDDIHAAAKALIELGVKPGDGVSIIGFNCREWLIANFAAIHAGAIPVGIYTTNNPEQCQYVTEHSNSTVVFVKESDNLQKFISIRQQLPKVMNIISMEAKVPESDKYFITWSDFMARGYASKKDAVLQERKESLKNEDIMTYIYTSGTTGNPKGCMIPHRSAVYQALTPGYNWHFNNSDHIISYLPFSHAAAQALDIYMPLAYGAQVWLCQPDCLKPGGSLLATLLTARPTVFLGVPRIWEKLAEAIKKKSALATGLKKHIATWARGVGLATHYANQTRSIPPLSYLLAKPLVFSKVHKGLGFDRVRLAITGAAPISRDTLELFMSLDIPIMEVYGMSENFAATTLSSYNCWRTGSVGVPAPDVQLKIAPDGEICYRGPHLFSGYFKNPEATAEAVDEEGWLHTGDVGEMKDGFLFITDRKKELIITAGGENVPPAIIEAQLKSIPTVAQAVVLGDRRKFISALFTLEPTALIAKAQEIGSPARDAVSAAKDSIYLAWLNKQVAMVNDKIASRAQNVRKFAILPQELTIDGGELTPTMKLKRRIVNTKYADIIEGIYADGE